MLFRGTHSVKVDDKGRLKLPSLVRDRLAERYGNDAGYFVTSLTGDRVLIYPLTEWERIEQILAQLPQFDETKERFLLTSAHYGAEASVDDQGRLLIPGKLREAAGTRGDVTLLWKLNRIEVYSAARFEAEVEAKRLTPADLGKLAELGI